MRLLLKIFLYCIASVVLLVAGGLLWFVYYSRDLPDTRSLAQFAPTTVTQVSDPCLEGPSIAIPYDLIGSNLRNALNAVEVGENDPGVLAETYRAFTDQTHLHRATLSMQISRTLFCTPSRMLRRQLDRFRMSEHLERRFSRRDLFTIYANRVYFGENLVGVHNASQYFFHKNPSELDLAQAALVAGLVRSPSRYSPLRHPDRVLQRRNEVIDAMTANGSASSAQGESAKAAALGVVADTTGAK